MLNIDYGLQAWRRNEVLGNKRSCQAVMHARGQKLLNSMRLQDRHRLVIPLWRMAWDLYQMTIIECRQDGAANFWISARQEGNAVPVTACIHRVESYQNAC